MFTSSPGSKGGNVVRLGALTRVTAPVRELVRAHPTSLVVQLFFTTNLAVALAPEGRVTAVGLAAIRGFGVEQAVANAGEASVGEVSLLEQPRAAVSNNPATTVREFLIGPPSHLRAAPQPPQERQGNSH
jgi:hypothetical protein